MVCKKCGFDIEKNWKYCPNCSKKIFKKHHIIMLGALTLFFTIYIIISIIKNSMPVDAKYIERELENKYNEKFNNILLIKTIENPDTNLSCDGTSFGTIKGEGSTEYYKVHSQKNDIDFIVTYDTSDKSKKINDAYEKNLKRRNTLMEAYEIVYKYLNNNIVRITLSDYRNNIKITSKNQLKEILSIYEEKNMNLKDIEIYIEENLFEFSKTNYEDITRLNDELVELQRKKDYYFSTIIVLNKNAKIELYGGLDDKVYVYDKYSNSTAWGETLDEFVNRESY